MKRLLTVIALLGLFLIPASADAKALKPSYCGTSAYDISYAKVYAYPGGSYWVSQIKAFPAFYSAHNAEYTKLYGC